MATLPSPSKQHRPEPATPTQVQDPTDLRGSFERAASQNLEVLKQQVALTSRNVRAQVGGGYKRPDAPSGRPLSKAKTEPTLNLGGSSGGFTTHNEIMEAVFGSGGSRRGELQPMYETRSPTSSAGGQLLYDKDGYFKRTPTIERAMEEDDMDGFDPDDVFGSPNKLINFDNPESQGQPSTSTGTGAGLKRAFEADEENDDDAQMDLTDVEDEGEEDEESMTPLEGGSKLLPTTRRGLARTQSLPASAFQAEF